MIARPALARAPEPPIGMRDRRSGVHAGIGTTQPQGPAHWPAHWPLTPTGYPEPMFDVRPSQRWRSIRPAWPSLALVLALALPAHSIAATLESVRVEGLAAPMADAVQRSLTLSRLNESQRANLSPARLAFLIRRAEREARAALEPFGHYHATVEIIERTGPQPDQLIILVRVDPGEPVRVFEHRIEVIGPAAAESSVIDGIAAFRPGSGDVFEHSRYQASKSVITRELARLGYFDATTEQARVEVTRAEHRADIALRWHSGPRYVFGDTRITGSPFVDGLLDPLQPWRPGEPYRQDALIDHQRRLSELDYFSVVEIRPAIESDDTETTDAPTEPGSPTQPEASDGMTTPPAVMPIALSLTPAPANVYSAALSIGTDSGAGVQFGYQRRWLNRLGHGFKGELQLAQRRQAAVGHYRIPAFARGAGWWGVRTGLRSEAFEGFDLDTLDFGVERTWRWHEWHSTAALIVQRERLDDRRARTVLPIVSENTLAYPALTTRTVRTDDPVFPTRGWSLDAGLRGGTGALGSDVEFIQAHAEARWLRALDADHRILLRSQAGATWVDSIRALPVGLRFFAGGDRSLRGYDLRTVAPELDGAVVGGRHLLIGSVELDRYFGTGRWGAAIFLDAGDAVDALSDYRPVLGAGIGLRWRSPVGPVRLDLAHGFDNPDEAFRIHLSIGPDL